MTHEPVAVPSLTADEHILVDWLELIAFFNVYGTARLDVIDAALAEQEESHEDNIARRDKLREQVREKIENEVDARRDGCEGGYPFVLTDDAEELVLVDDWLEEKYCFYMTCLLTSHLSTNSLLKYEVSQDLISRLRNRVFQVLSVFAMAGWLNGLAASIGWPREDNQTILDRLTVAASRGAGIVPRAAVADHTPPAEKDGGIDIMAWSQEDRPPPTQFGYGQVASGHNWKGKPVSVYVRTFEDSYIDQRLGGDHLNATLMPFRETDKTVWFRESKIHGTILDRTRIPKYANVSLTSVHSGVVFDESHNMSQIVDWVGEMREFGLVA